MDILIVKLGALGDVINTLPLAIALKRDLKARIHWLVAPLSYPIVAAHDHVDHAILFNPENDLQSIARTLTEMRSQQFDIVLDLQRMIKSGILSFVARGRKIGFDKRRCKEMTWLLPFERIPPANPQSHMVHQYMEFATYLGVSDAHIEWRIRLPGQFPALELPSEYVVLNIGATKRANRWAAERFAALARAVHADYQMPCILTGGQEDLPMAQAIKSAAKEVVFDWVGRTTLQELMAILSAARAVVTCDTGPMHLAVAMGKKVVALFGPSDHRRTGPFHGKVLRGKIDCAPCNRKNCDIPQCMSAIRPEDVLRVLSVYLKHDSNA
jgi:ADP-heptose:LPS heptosyltransferase